MPIRFYNPTSAGRRAGSVLDYKVMLTRSDGEKAYILAPNGLKVGQTVVSGPDAAPEIGNCLPLTNIPGGLELHNIELNPGQGGKLVRSAGGVARLGAKEGL